MENKLNYAFQSLCPYCGSDNVFYYFENTKKLDYVVYECTCKDCKTVFREYYDMVFAEQLITKCSKAPELEQESLFPEPKSKE